MALSRRTGQRFQGSVWPGFVDAITGLLMVMTFVLTIFMVVQFVLRETISGQEDELTALSDEVAALADALGLEERENSRLQARLGALNTTLSQAEEDLSQAQALISSLTSERDQRAAELEEAQLVSRGSKRKLPRFWLIRRVRRAILPNWNPNESNCCPSRRH